MRRKDIERAAQKLLEANDVTRAPFRSRNSHMRSKLMSVTRKVPTMCPEH
jgi:hypothetical protein